MALPPGFLDELRARVSIARVAGRKVTWDNRKTNAARGDYWAPCPFHEEKTPSFHVDDGKGFFHCFGCHAKGDAITFVRETENVGFMEAVEILAREAGMAVPARDPEAAARDAARAGLAEAMEAAVRFYRTQLTGARAAEARDYLDRRGVGAAARERFELGYAPDGRTVLQEHRAAKGFAPETLAEAGLTGRPEDGGPPYDRFRGRLMFPIRDGRGRAIAFGARALRPGQEPKYLNSPETPLFDKSRSLYTAARRNFLPPMMLAFDTPIPFNTMGRRSVSNVPAQALILMNDPFVVAESKRWGGRVAAASGSVDARIERMYLAAFGRPPAAAERSAAAAFVGPSGGSADAWADLAHVLFNVKEFIYAR